MDIARLSLTYRKAVVLIVFILVIGGIYAAFRLPSGIYPEVDFPRIVVVAEAGDLPTGNMMLAVTRPIEDAVSSVQGIYRVRSRTIRGEAELSLQFLPRSDLQLGLQQAQSKISEIRSSLPSETQITIERLTPAVFPVMSFNVSGTNLSPADLRDYAVYTIRPLISRIPGVGQVRVLGDTVREIEVVVDPQKLLATKLTLEQVGDAIRGANAIEAVGRLNKDYKQFLVLVSGELNISAIGSIVVKKPEADGNGQVVFLRDIATVQEGTQDKLMLITGGGRPAAQVNVSRQIGANIISVEQAVKNSMQEMKRILPPGVRLDLVYDLAEFVKDSIRSVRDAILLGCGLSILILIFFLREWRSTLIAALAIPTTLLITLFFMHRIGQTLNLMSLGGMAVAIGLVVDDAIVVIENIHRHIQLGQEDRETAIQNGTNEVFGAVLGSTLTTVVVFLPLGLVEGVVGQFFAAFSITLSVAVLISLLLAFTAIPLMAQWLLAKQQESQNQSSRSVRRLSENYDRLVSTALSHRRLVFVLTILFLLMGVFIYTRLGSGFLPIMDEGSFVLDYWTPEGTSLAETDRVLHKIEQDLKETTEVEAISRRTGAELGLFATAQNTGDILVRLKKDRSRDVEEIMGGLRERIESSFPNCRVEFIQILQDLLGDLEGAPDPIEVKIFGDDPAILQERAEKVGEEVEKIPGIVDLFNGVLKGNPEMIVRVDSAQAQRLGFTAETVAKQVSNALLGEVVTNIRQFDRLIGVRVRFPDAARFNPALVNQFPLVTPTGAVVPLNAVASVQEVNGQSELLRENQRQMVAVTARLEGTSLGNAIPRIRAILNKIPLPVGYSYEIGGQYQSQQNSFRQLLLVLFIAVMLVFILLVIQFRAFTPALVILAAAPVSLIGAFVMLWITGTEFNVSSFMGLIMLVGLIVKNGIILIEYTYQIMEEKMLGLHDALIEAGKTRLRPILMTTLATIFGLLPLALGLGAGSELQKPLALAVIGGLSLSTLVTLLFVPTALLNFSKEQQIFPNRVNVKGN